MGRYSAAGSFAHKDVPRTGLLLTNLGTPAAPTPRAVRRYLGEFLWDPRVVELPRPLWWLILHGIVLRLRPARSARLYSKIWTAQGSPLLAISRRLAGAVAAALQRQCSGPIEIVVGMRYGEPSVVQGLRELRARGVRRLLVLPLYPQYSATTTASSIDAVTAELRHWRWLPELRFVTQYHDDPGYLDALADSVRAAWRDRPPAERLLFSFHGLPKRFHLAGDPYHCQCQKTARLVADRLELPAERYQVAFQSRFGRAEWLQPYTDETLRGWASAGVRSVEVICPGFAADCLETLEEVGISYREHYLAAGGETYHYIPALNDSPAHVSALAALAHRHMAGWAECSPAYDAAAVVAQTHAQAERARAMGAER